MSVHWSDRVWRLSQQTGNALLLMLAIADNANDYGVAWPGYGTLAKKTRLSSRTIQRMIDRLNDKRELATHAGGGGPRDTNTYVILLGREPEEIDGIIKSIQLKGVNLSLLKGGQFVYLDNLTKTKKAKKVDTAVSSDPSMNHGKSMDGWMETDPICCFLKCLPGYNAAGLKTDRAAIAPNAQAYDLEALQYLWEDCQTEADNPIGLFLYRAKLGMQSPRYTEACARRRDEAARQQVDEARRNAPVLPTEPDPPVQERQPYVPDPSVTQPIGGTHMTPLQVWQAAQGELQLQMTKATYDTWVKQTSVVSVNGTWKIAVPTNYAKEWWDSRLLTTVKRVLHGIVGQPCEPEFVVYQRGEA